MEYLLLYAEGTDPQPYDPADDTIAAWVADVEARGVSEFGERLRPGQDATTVRVREGRTLTTEGPFTEAKEWVGGLDIIDCRDLDEAIAIAARHPVARFGTVEVRPFVRWPDADPGARVVPPGLADRPVKGKRYVMFVCADPFGETGGQDDPETWVEEMDGRGVRLFGEVLRPPADATQVRDRGGRVLVTDGPFTEAKEWIAGLDLIEVRGLGEAIEVAAAHPMARGGSIVLSPLWPLDPEDDHVARAEREAPERGRRLEPRVGVER
ncbi:MAG: YciI family protein [Propionicimonas sp.]|nr:YciI family protein [Propionicimonas sp.]